MAATVASETNDDSLHNAEPVVRREPQVVVALECDRPLAGSARFSLAGVDEVRFGHGPTREARRITDDGYTTIHISIPASTMSSAHARLLRSQGKWILEDSGSRNGSFVDGQRVTRAAVGEAEVLEMGHALFLVREGVSMLEGPADLDGAALRNEPNGFRTLVPPLACGLAALRRLAPTRVPILILGETGTGKEAIAHAIHVLSQRAGPFVPINCGALAASLVEAQLFGHVRGAFSGATRDEVGFVRSAHGGTLLLDEIGELPRSCQTTLLRVLQEGEVVPVGSTRATKVDLRVVSATHRALLQEDAGFRTDLFARLAGHIFTLPPLRARIEDLGLAVAQVLEAHAPARGEGVALTSELGRMLLQHPWPLNFRELTNAFCAGLPLSDDGILRIKHFPGLLPPRSSTPAIRVDVLASAGRSLRDEDQRLRIAIIAHMREKRGNVAAVARAMGKAPMQVHRWMKRFGIDPRSFRG